MTAILAFSVTVLRDQPYFVQLVSPTLTLLCCCNMFYPSIIRRSAGLVNKSLQHFDNCGVFGFFISVYVTATSTFSKPT